MLLAAVAVSFASCEPTPTPEPEPEPKPGVTTFDVQIGEVTSSSVAYTVTPSNLEAEYLCVLYDAETVEEYTRDEFLVQQLMMDLEEDARSKGKTLAEYMPSDLMLGEKVTEANNLLFDQIVVPLPKDLTGKRIVLMNPTNALSSYVFVDNLSLEKQQGWQTPVITTSTITPTTLTVDWTAPGSSTWNVYLTQNTANFPLANVPVKDIANGVIVLDNNQKVTGVKIMPRNIFILDQSMQDAIIMNLKKCILS